MRNETQRSRPARPTRPAMREVHLCPGMCGKEIAHPGYCRRCADEVGFLRELYERPSSPPVTVRKPRKLWDVVLIASVVLAWAYVVWLAFYPIVVEYFLQKGGY